MALDIVTGAQTVDVNRGSARRPIPPDLHQALVDFYYRCDGRIKAQVLDASYADGKKPARGNFIELPEWLKTRVHEQLKPICQDWCNNELRLAAIVGLRRHRRGCTVAVETGAIGISDVVAVLPLAFRLDEPWPMILEDKDGVRETLSDFPGEMVLYDGGYLAAGRPEPLNGEFSCELAVHFSAAGKPSSGRIALPDLPTKDLAFGTEKLTPDWRSWIAKCLESNTDTTQMLETLINARFDPREIKRAMGDAYPGYCCAADPQPVDYSALAAPPFVERAEKLGAEKLPTDLVQMYVMDDFMSADECQGMLDVIANYLRPSTVASGFDSTIDDAVRTSSTSDIYDVNDPVVVATNEKISRTLGIHNSHADAIEAQLYMPGQQYKGHLDAFTPGMAAYDQYGSRNGNRTWTFMIYLNDVEAGGQTGFEKLEIATEPKQGRAVIWNNLHPDGRINLNALHAGTPVVAGQKYVITKWFRAYGAGPTFRTDQP